MKQFKVTQFDLEKFAERTFYELTGEPITRIVKVLCQDLAREEIQKLQERENESK